MKKVSFLFMVAFVIMMMQSVTSFADDKYVSASQLPANVTSFITKYFPNKTATYAEMDIQFGGAKYEVSLSDGTEIDFDKKGGWEKIDCKMGSVPATFIPEAIANYVKANFPGATIVKIDKERYGYEIELSNDLDMKFNKGGKLIAMDD